MFSAAVSPEPAQAARASLAPPLHRIGERRDINTDTAVAQRILGQIQREP